MRRVFPAAFLAAVALPAAAAAQAPEKQLITLANDSSRVVDCALIIDGKTRSHLKIRPGRHYAEAFDPRRLVQVVCERTRPGVQDVKAGARYRFTDGDRRVEIAEVGAE